MKILCFIDSLDSGGAQRQLIGLASMLKQFYQVEVLSYWNIHFWDEYLINNGIDFQTITNANNTITKFYHVYRYFKKYSPDVVISYLGSPCVIACLIRIIIGGKFYLIVSERNVTQHLTMREKIRFFLFRWADVIVPNSYTQTEFIQKHYLSFSNKVVTITNFTDTDYFIPNPFNRKMNEILSILVVGRISPAKNVLNLIEAIYILTQNRYKVIVNWVGRPNPEFYYHECMDKLREYKLTDIFRFKEHTNNILLEYHNADVFCLPSNYEGYPNVLCEAMSCGLPVLCSNVCDNPEIIEDGKNGFLFSPLIIEDIADKFIKFINLTESEKGKMRHISRLIAKAKFSKDAFLQKYVHLISYRNAH